MSDLLRDAPIGQLVRWVTRNRVLQYPEEKPGFHCPTDYRGEKSSTPIADPLTVSNITEKLDELPTPGAHYLAAVPTAPDIDPFERAGSQDAFNSRTLSKTVTRPEMSKVHTRADLEQAYTNATHQGSMKHQPSRPIVPEKTADGTILVDWYDTNDPENPQNWSSKKKGLVVLQIYLYTLAVYIG